MTDFNHAAEVFGAQGANAFTKVYMSKAAFLVRGAIHRAMDEADGGELAARCRAAHDLAETIYSQAGTNLTFGSPQQVRRSAALDREVQEICRLQTEARRFDVGGMHYWEMLAHTRGIARVARRQFLRGLLGVVAVVSAAPVLAVVLAVLDSRF